MMNCLSHIICLLFSIIFTPTVLCAEFPTYPHPTIAGRNCCLCPPGYRIDGIYDKARSCDLTTDGSPTFPDCVECSDGYYMESWTMNHICKEQKWCDKEGEFLLYSGDKTQPNVCGCKDGWYHSDNRCKKSKGNNCPASVVTPVAQKLITKTTTTTEKTSTTTKTTKKEPVGPNINLSQNVSRCDCLVSIIGTIGAAALIITFIVVILRVYLKDNFSQHHTNDLKEKKALHNKQVQPAFNGPPKTSLRTLNGLMEPSLRTPILDEYSMPMEEEKSHKRCVTSKGDPTSKENVSCKHSNGTIVSDKKILYVNMEEDTKSEDSTLKKDKSHKQSSLSIDESTQYVNMDEEPKNKATPFEARGNRDDIIRAENPTYMNLNSERQKLDKVFKVVEKKLLQSEQQQLFRHTLLLTTQEIDRLSEHGPAARTMYALAKWQQKNPSTTAADFIKVLRENEFFEIAHFCEVSLQSNVASVAI